MTAMIPHIVISLVLRDVNFGVQRRNFVSTENGCQRFLQYDCALAVFLLRKLTKANIGDLNVGDEGLEIDAISSS
jgi:hypothetical protein